MVWEDTGKFVDACQDAKRSRGGSRTDSPPREYIHAILTRAQKRKKDHSPVMLDKNSDLDSESEETSSPVQRGKRHHHRDFTVNQSLETWTPAFLAEKQGKDHDLALVKVWLNASTPPDWNEI